MRMSCNFRDASELPLPQRRAFLACFTTKCKHIRGKKAPTNKKNRLAPRGYTTLLHPHSPIEPTLRIGIFCQQGKKGKENTAANSRGAAHLYDSAKGVILLRRGVLNSDTQLSTSLEISSRASVWERVKRCRNGEVDARH